MSSKNVIDHMCERFKTAKTAIVLTHNIDFLFVESMLLPRLRAIGHPQLTIFADAACASQSYRDQYKLIEHLGSLYRVVPIDLGNARRFHPKAFFLSDQEKAALAVGSGNATYGGWSANQEIWSDFSSVDEGASAITAFRDYLDIILDNVPEKEYVRETSVKAFSDETNVWASVLPSPGLIAYTPRSETMIEQMTAFAGDEIDSIKVFSPYFDPEAAALKYLATLVTDEVWTYLQPHRAGLSMDLLPDLPENVRLGMIEDVEEDQRHKFIHAKAYILKAQGDSIVCIGSANCSRAALMADSSWGNAELMALKRLPTNQSDDLFSTFRLAEGAPALPPTHPSEEWEFTQSELRIISAHHENDRLVIHYKSEREPQSLYAKSDEWAESSTATSLDPKWAVFLIERHCETVTLQAVFADGQEANSAPAWVDHEEALRAGSAMRSLLDHLANSKHDEILTAGSFLKILELFEEHLKQPVPGQAKRGRSKNAVKQRKQRFTEDDIYAKDFGKASTGVVQRSVDGFGQIDTLALLFSFFQTRERRPPNGSVTPPPGDEEHEDGSHGPSTEGSQEQNKDFEKFGKKIERLISRIEQVISKPDFITSRPASRLSADISFIALLFAKASMDGLISAEFFQAKTIAIWQTLFYGKDGGIGTLPAHLASLGTTELSGAPDYIEELSDSRLSAAMALWCMMERHTSESHPYFRCAAAQLAAEHPWLVQGGEPDEIVSVLDDIVAKLFPAESRLDLHYSWANCVRDAQAIETLTSALKEKDQKELADLTLGRNFEPNELFWQKNRGFCVLSKVYDRTLHKNVELRPIFGVKSRKVKAGFVAPIIDIMKAGLDISDSVANQLNEMFGLSQVLPEFDDE